MQGVSFNVIAREWRLKWAGEKKDEKTLKELQDLITSQLSTIKAIKGFTSVQRIICGGCHDFKIVIAIAEPDFKAWEEAKFAPEAEYLAKAATFANVSTVETQTYTLMTLDTATAPAHAAAPAAAAAAPAAAAAAAADDGDDEDEGDDLFAKMFDGDYDDDDDDDEFEMDDEKMAKLAAEEAADIATADDLAQEEEAETGAKRPAGGGGGAAAGAGKKPKTST